MGEHTKCELCKQQKDCGWIWLESNFEIFDKPRKYKICDDCKNKFVEQINRMLV